MKKLSKKERIKAYQWVISQIKDRVSHAIDQFSIFDITHGKVGTHRGVCVELAAYTEDENGYKTWPSGYSIDAVEKLFPEFMKCRPPEIKSGYWWDRDLEGAIIRICALELCIKQLKRKHYLKINPAH